MELYIDSQDPDSVEALYGFLWDRREQIEAAYGGPLSWEELPGKRASRIAAYTDGDVAHIEDHDKYIEWFFDACGRLRSSLQEPAAEWFSHG
jgi:hypothetical protein